MIIVFRWWYVAGLAGLVASVIGGIETDLALKCGAEPTPVTIEQLTAGTVPAQPWVKLGSHFALNDHVVWLESRGRVHVALHPVIAASHPYNEAWRALNVRYSRLEDVPVGQLPRLSGVRVVVKSKALPANDATTEVDSVEGMLFSGSSLDSDERQLVESRLPVTDARQLLVLEADRRPWPIALAIGTLLLGMVAIGWAIRRFRMPVAAT